MSNFEEILSFKQEEKKLINLVEFKNSLLDFRKNNLEEEKMKNILKQIKQIFSEIKELSKVIISSPIFEEENCDLIKFLIDIFLSNRKFKYRKKIL